MAGRAMQESLGPFGWVAIWRPIELFLTTITVAIASCTSTCCVEGERSIGDTLIVIFWVVGRGDDSEDRSVSGLFCILGHHCRHRAC